MSRFLVNIFFSVNIARTLSGIRLKRSCGCIGTSPLFDFFALPVIELGDIFSLDSPAKQEILFVIIRQPFNLSSFRAISGAAIAYGSRSDSLSNGPATKESTNGYEHVGMQKGTNFSFVYAILLIGLNSKS